MAVHRWIERVPFTILGGLLASAAFWGWGAYRHHVIYALGRLTRDPVPKVAQEAKWALANVETP